MQRKRLHRSCPTQKSGALTCVHSVWIRWYAITLPSLPQAQALLRQPLQNIRLNPETGQSFFLLLITSKGTARLCGSPFFYLRSLYRLLTGKHRKILLCSPAISLFLQTDISFPHCAFPFPGAAPSASRFSSRDYEAAAFLF